MDSTNSQHLLEQSRIGETTAGPQQAAFYRQSVAEQTLCAYHGDPAVKAKHIARMRAHQEADELIRGTYWEGGKGCAIGCTVHSDDHGAYETELGMPEWLAHLEDKIFEGMTIEDSRRFPLDLLSTIPVGFAEWDRLYHEFCAYVLRDICWFDRTVFPDVAAAVDAIVHLHEQMTESDDQAWSAARLTAELAAESVAASVAHSAARSAWSAAHSAARSAALAAAWSASWLMTEATAYSTARSAAQSAIWSARSAAQSAKAAARSTAYNHMGNWLVCRFDAAGGSR